MPCRDVWVVARKRWSGINPDAPCSNCDNVPFVGGAECDIGCCAPFMDYPNANLLTGQIPVNQGTRWMRPHPQRGGRDASGMLHDLRSNQPHAIPYSAVFQRAPCWQWPGVECYDQDHCDCVPPISNQDDVNGRCLDGSRPGGIFTLRRPDYFSFSGTSFSQSDEQGWIYCRRAEYVDQGNLQIEHGPIDIRLGAGRLFQASFHRDNVITSDMFVLCNGRAYPSRCNTGWDQCSGEGNNRFYWVNACRQARYNYVELEYLREHPQIPPTILLDPNAPYQDATEVAIKNEVLAKMRTTVFPGDIRLNRLDNQQFQNNGNTFLDYWSREWNATPDAEASSLPLAYRFQEARFPQIGCTGTAELVFRSAKIEADIVAHGVKETTSPTQDLALHGKIRVYPSIRMRYRAELGLRYAIPPTCRSGGFPVTVAGNGTQTPRLMPMNDRPILKALGKTVKHPPLHVEWWGYVGAFGSVPWHNVWPEPPAGPNGVAHGRRDPSQACNTLADAMTGRYHPYEVTGWPTHRGTDPEHSAKIYGGTVGLRFPFDNRCLGI